MTAVLGHTQWLLRSPIERFMKACLSGIESTYWVYITVLNRNSMKACAIDLDIYAALCVHGSTERRAKIYSSS